MAKDKSDQSKEERRLAKKQAKESSLIDSGAISKSKSDKKEKKDKKKQKEAVAEKLLAEVEKSDGKVVQVSGSHKVLVADEVVSEDEESGDVVMSNGTKPMRPIGALVPFANPLADEKVSKKLFRGVKKAAAQRTLKRGVKEVVKALRKSGSTNTTPAAAAPGIIVLAADISPMDVISHIPVLCEDHSIPYIYVTSRAQLGIAGQTKRPTSVVMIGREAAKGKQAEKAKEDEDGEKWEDVYKGLLKVVEREGKHVKV